MGRMQIRVNRDGLVEKCREFARKNIPVRWALIDDMWADVQAFKGAVYSCRDEMISLMHGSALASFNADPDRFPGGLKAAVDEMKRYVRCVGAWHPLTGYWFGIEENGELYEQFKDILYRAPDGRIIIKPDYPSFKRFFGAFHKYLAECGVDFVKADNQSIIRKFYAGYAPIGKIARDMHAALDQSVRENFGGTVINCMGCASDNVFSRPEARYRDVRTIFCPTTRHGLPNIFCNARLPVCIKARSCGATGICGGQTTVRRLKTAFCGQLLALRRQYSDDMVAFRQQKKRGWRSVHAFFLL